MTTQTQHHTARSAHAEDHQAAAERRERDLGPRTIFLLAAGMACFGSATPVSALVGRHFPIWLGSFLRLVIAAAVLLPPLVAAQRRKDLGVVTTLRDLDRADRWRLAAMAAIGTFGFSAFMLLGMREAPGTVGAVVMATTPAVTAIGAVLFLHDRLDHWQVLALAMAVAGVVAVDLGSDATGTGQALLTGSALVFAAVCCEATYSLVGKRLTTDLSPLLISTAAAVLGAVLFAPFALWDLVHLSWSKLGLTDWLAVIWWGAGTFALGSWLWLQGMARASASTASAFMAVMPVSALALSYVLLGEAFQWIHLVGMALVLAGLACVIRGGSAVH